MDISDLARLGMKPRLCRLSWRAFASIHPLMLPSTFPREVLLARPYSPPWNPLLSLWSPPFSLHALALIFFFLTKMRLSLTLTLSPLSIWCFRLTALFLFFGKYGSGVLANCSLCGTDATLSFSAGLACSSFSAEACTILQALCWSRQH